MKKRFIALMAALLLLPAVCAFAEVAETAETPALQPGDVITFGRYPEAYNLITWRVLAVDDFTATLISEDVIACMRFDYDSSDWASSDLCQWLNGLFLKNAFNQNESWRLIANEEGHRVVIPSREDILNPLYGFSQDSQKKDDARRAKKAEMLSLNSLWTSKQGYCTYFLRTAEADDNVYQVRATGNLGVAKVTRENVGIRPMIRVYVNGLEPN